MDDTPSPSSAGPTGHGASSAPAQRGAAVATLTGAGSSTRVHVALNELCNALHEQGFVTPAESESGYEGLPQNVRLLMAFAQQEARSARAFREAQGLNRALAVPPVQAADAPPSTSSLPAAPDLSDLGAEQPPYEPPTLDALLTSDVVPDLSDLGAGVPDGVAGVDSKPTPGPSPTAGNPVRPASATVATPAKATAPAAPEVRRYAFEDLGTKDPARAVVGPGGVAGPAARPVGAAAPALPSKPAHGASSSVSGGAPATPQAPAVAAAAPPPAPVEPMKKVIHLKNARVNDPYVGLIDVPGVKALKVIDDAGTGLHLDESGKQLVGKLKTAGDFVIRLAGQVGERRCELFANIAAIPDPRSLWVSKDSDRTAPFWKPDEASGRIIGDELLCVAASKRGRSHAKDGTFRDDDFALWSGGTGGWHIAVVADGAGSAKFSRRGSQIAVGHVTKELPRLLDEHLTPNLERLIAAHQGGIAGAQAQMKTALYSSMVTAAFNAAKAIVDEAHKIGEKSAAFRTTLVVVVARATVHGWFIAAFAIGDGGAAIFDRDAGTIMPLNLADGGEFAGQTRFLETSEFQGGYEELSKRLFFDVRPSFTAIFAMTDGITDPKFPTDVAFANPQKWVSFWDDDLTPAVRLQRGNGDIESELLAWLDFWSPGNHDDRTLAVMLAQDAQQISTVRGVQGEQA